MKLNADAPMQHLAIIAIVGVVVFLNIVDTLKGGSSRAAAQVPQFVENTDGTRYSNPRLSVFEQMFCRGFQRSSFCSYAFRHPILENSDRQPEAAPPKNDRVVDFHGSLSEFLSR